MKTNKKVRYILLLIFLIALSLAGPWGFGKIEHYLLEQIKQEQQQEREAATATEKGSHQNSTDQISENTKEETK